MPRLISIPGSGFPRMIPLQRISTRVVIPTTIVTSPGFQVSVCRLAMIQERMNGAAQPAIRNQRRIGNVWKAVALSLGPTLADSIFEFGLLLVENHGSHSDANRISADAIPRSSPGVNRE